jgi:hypothetical protein
MGGGALPHVGAEGWDRSRETDGLKPYTTVLECCL